ncbi:MAG TPA: response regulator [Gaiellaceae bacterium]|nr:response regulator [Gaiellaceae bacterium]
MRILVADDSPQLVLLYRAILEDAGYEVVSVSNGMAAIAAVEGGQVDAAVLDVLMPGVSGDAIAERLRRTNPDLPVLLMTGDYGEQFVVDVRAPVLRKPFPPEELVRAVEGLTNSTLN